MDERLKAIVRARIQSERNRREIPAREALGAVQRAFSEKSALGSSRYPLYLDAEAAKEYDLRTERWLEVVSDAMRVAAVMWTEQAAKEVQHLIQQELAADWEQLIEMLRRFAHPLKPAMSDLDRAKDRASGTVSHKLDLLVYAQDRSRIPLAELLTAPRYAAILAALRKARQLLDAATPDYSNAAKEAVGAVEQLARLVTAKPTATLGDCIKDLRATGRIEPPLLKGIEETWGWSSNTPGVRHGTDLAADAPTSRYIVAQSEAALALLLSVDVA